MDDESEIRFAQIELGDPTPDITVASEPEQPTDGATRVVPALKLERSGCYHHAPPVVEDGVERLTCSACGCDLNPFIVLRQIAHKEMNFCYQLESLRKEASSLHAEVKSLKATRARLRRELKDQC